MKEKILIIDDEVPLLKALERVISKAGFLPITTPDPEEAFRMIQKESFDLVLTDVRMPKISGIDLLKKIKECEPHLEVLVMTAVGSIQIAVDAMKAGAYDFITKPFETPDVVVLAIQKALAKKKLQERNLFLEQQVELVNRFENMVGTSAQIKNIFRMIESVAASESTILVTGESGTGKELVARAIHERSPRASKPFLAVNCSAFNENLLESELFGHSKGSFTGAVQARRGLFDEANGGTLFLDEIGDTSLTTQVKLLRVLQEGEFKPVGSNEMRKVDVRVISATNMDLPNAIKEKRFREDLYYRINVIPIHLPPLRDRPEDVPLLMQYFLRKFARKQKKEVHGFSDEAKAICLSYRWPGNVRELENTIERALVLSKGETISKEDLPESMQQHANINASKNFIAHDLPYQAAKKMAVSAFDRQYIEDVLSRSNGVIAEAARLAGMDRSNFRRLLNEYEIDVSRYKHD